MRVTSLLLWGTGLAHAAPMVDFAHVVPEVAKRPFGALSALMEFSPFQAGVWMGYGGFGGSNEVYQFEEDSELELWLTRQKKVAFESILENIGGIGRDDVAPGAVIASPSKMMPNYFYQWTRDAAITIQSLVEYLDDNLFEEGEYDLVTAIELYILNSYHLQRLDNKSGTWKSLEGLGEPKFMADSTTFDDHWGRPQRDGPALRTITISNYLQLLSKYGKNVKNQKLHSAVWIYENIVKADLYYIIESWFKPGFDLWEEIDSVHLFTALTQLKALQCGFDLAELVGEKDDKFLFKLRASFQALRFFIVVDSGFKGSSVPYLVETPSLVVQGSRSGLDIASILASLRSHDMTARDSQQIPFPVEDSAVISTLMALVNDMKYRYPINHKLLGTVGGVALGRYPEDVYDGYGVSEGNPWFISTATASELVYKLVYQLHNIGEIRFTKEQADLIKEITGVKLKPNGNGIHILTTRTNGVEQVSHSLFKFGDSFLEIIKTHVDGGGHMSEQFNRYDGYLEGAEDLTWSYGSFWSAMRWRQKALDLLG